MFERNTNLYKVYATYNIDKLTNEKKKSKMHFLNNCKMYSNTLTIACIVATKFVFPSFNLKIVFCFFFLKKNASSNRFHWHSLPVLNTHKYQCLATVGI